MKIIIYNYFNIKNYIITSNSEVINLNSIIYCDLIDKVTILKEQLLQFYKNDTVTTNLKFTISDLTNFLENNTIKNLTGETLNNDTNWLFDYSVYDINGTKLFIYALNYDVFNPYKPNSLNSMIIFDLDDFKYIEIRYEQYDYSITFRPVSNTSTEIIVKYINIST